MIWIIGLIVIIVLFILFTKVSIVKLSENGMRDVFIKDLSIVNELKFKQGDYGLEDYEYFKKYMEDNSYELFNVMIMFLHNFEKRNHGYVLKTDLIRIRDAWSNVAWPAIAFSKATGDTFSNSFKSYAKNFLETLNEEERYAPAKEKKFLIELKDALVSVITYL